MRPSSSFPAPRASGPSPSFTEPLSAPVAPAPPLNDATGLNGTGFIDTGFAATGLNGTGLNGKVPHGGGHDVADHGGTDELFRAWQGSVREAAARRDPWQPHQAVPVVARRRRGRQLTRIGLPAAVIITVGAGALLMLTGRANNMLAERSTSGPAAQPPSASATSLALAGYPGEHGTVGVTALWTARGTTVAVGYADNHPAVWRHASDGSWSLVSAAVLGSLPGHFTSVSDGPLGWIAVGSAQEDGLVEPVVYASTDGVTWTPLPGLTGLAGTDAEFLGVSASSAGYLVVGKSGTGSTAYADFWWSSDLRNWTAGGNSANQGSAATAAVATPDGFAAVGSENGCHTIWTSADGRTWTGHDLAKPDGATTATLRYVTAGSGTVVGAGFAVTSSGNVPLVVTTTDDGAHVTQVILESEGTAMVTGVTATAAGYVAVGTTGTGSAEHAVTWTSPDGLTWSPAATVTKAGHDEITALTSTGTAISQHSNTPAILTLPTS